MHQLILFEEELDEGVMVVDDDVFFDKFFAEDAGQVPGVGVDEVDWFVERVLEEFFRLVDALVVADAEEVDVVVFLAVRR